MFGNTAVKCLLNSILIPGEYVQGQVFWGVQHCFTGMPVQKQNKRNNNSGIKEKKKINLMFNKNRERGRGREGERAKKTTIEPGKKCLGIKTNGLLCSPRTCRNIKTWNNIWCCIASKKDDECTHTYVYISSSFSLCISLQYYNLWWRIWFSIRVNV